jgi:rhamnogalacturonyl hydrolase YesR
MWPWLLQRPTTNSPAETSGTAMIAWHLTRAILDGRLGDPKYLAAVQKAYAALPACVRDDGTVFNTSHGPGPLETETPWLVPTYPPGDPHGTFSLLYAASGEALLKNHR